MLARLEVHDIVILRNILGFFFGGGRESGFTLFARTKADMIFFFAPQRSKTRVFRQKACAAVPQLLDRQPWFNGVFFRLEGVGKKGCFLVFFAAGKRAKSRVFTGYQQDASLCCHTNITKATAAQSGHSLSLECATWVFWGRVFTTGYRF